MRRPLMTPPLSFPQHGRARLALVASVLLAALLALRLGWAWQQLGGADDAPAPEATLVAPAALPVDVVAVQELGLFGAREGASAGSVSVPGGSMPTALALSLEGVVLGASEQASLAFIVVNGTQRSFKIGDTLPAGVNVRLAAIAEDHVVLSNDGTDETLWLYADGKPQRLATPVQPTAPILVAPSAQQRGVVHSEAGGVMPAAPLAALPPDTTPREAAAVLAEVIQIVPEQANGQLVGYRLSPGKRLKEFFGLGFQTNDIVTAANGIALNDVANLPQLYGLLNGAADVSFSLLRAGPPLTLRVRLTP